MAESLQGYGALIRRLQAVGSPPATARLMAKLGENAIQREKALAPKKTGNLRQSIHVAAVSATSIRLSASANYAAYVEYGTGLFGPKHERITPKAAKALRWMGGTFGPKGSLRLTGSRRKGRAGAGAGWVFAKSTKGSPARPFMVAGAKAAVEASPLAKLVVTAWNDAA